MNAITNMHSAKSCKVGLDEVSFHDGYLDGIVLGREHDGYLVVRTASGSEYRLLMRGIRLLEADGFRQGNILFDIEVHAPTVAPHEAFSGLVGDPDDQGYGVRVLAERERMANNGEVLLLVASSYGCTLAAICVEVELAQCLEGPQRRTPSNGAAGA